MREREMQSRGTRGKHYINASFIHVPGGGVYDVTNPELFCCTPLPAVCCRQCYANSVKPISPFALNLSFVTLQMLFMLTQLHYALTKVKKVKSYYMTPLKNVFIHDIQ